MVNKEMSSTFDVYQYLKVEGKKHIKELYGIENEDHYILYITTKLVACMDNSLWIYDEDIMSAYSEKDREEVVIFTKLEIVIYAFLLAAHYGIPSYDVSILSSHEVSTGFTLDICGIVLNSIKNKDSNKDIVPLVKKYIGNLIHELKLGESSTGFGKELVKYVQQKESY